MRLRRQLEKATSRLDPVDGMEPTGDGTPELVHTPGCAAIADVAAFFKISPASDIKCVAYMALKRGTGKGERTRGTASPPSCAAITRSTKPNCWAPSARPSCAPCRPRNWSSSSMAPRAISAPSASSTTTQPLGDGLTVVVDKSLEGRKNMVCGANQLDYHLRNVVPGRDFTWTVPADIRSVNEGERCPDDNCSGKLVVGKAVEVGHIFKLGNNTQIHGLRVLDPNGARSINRSLRMGLGDARPRPASLLPARLWRSACG